MVVLAVIGMTVLGIQAYSFGIFMKPVTEELHLTRGALTLAITLPGFLGGLIQIYAGRLTDKYGPRYLVFLCGVVTFIGYFLMSKVQAIWQVYVIYLLPMLIGNACGYLPIVANLTRWFGPRFLGTAIGISVTGFTIGGSIGPMMIQSLISAYGWRQAYILMGLTFIVVLGIISPFMKQSPRAMSLQPLREEVLPAYEPPAPVSEPSLISRYSSPSTEGMSFIETVKTGRFWIFSIIGIVYLFAWMSMIQHLAPHATDIGIPAMTAASIVSIIAIGGIFGKLVFGVVVGWTGTRKAICGCLVIFTLPQLLLLFGTGIWSFYCFAVIFGFAYGGMVTLTNVGTTEFFGVRSIGTILAVYYYVTGFGSLVGPSMFGFIFDFTGGYRLAFLITIVLCVCAFILSLILLRSEGKEQRNG